MEVKNYRKKPVVIEAIRWSGKASDFISVMQFMKNQTTALDSCAVDRLHPLRIMTLEGEMLASPGDYIIKGVQGEFYPCKPDIFATTYELADEPALEPSGMNFGQAIMALKQGEKVAREGWNGKGMFLRLVFPYNNSQFDLVEKEIEGTFASFIGMKTADNMFVPWVASQTDMLAEDWMIVE
jgi:hypothetical protein